MKYIIHGLKKYGSVSGTPLYFEMGSLDYFFTTYLNPPRTTGWSTIDVGLDLYWNGGVYYLPWMTNIKDNNQYSNYFPVGFSSLQGKYRKDMNFSIVESNGDYIVSCPNVYASVPSEISWSLYDVTWRYYNPTTYTGNNYLPISDISINYSIGDIVDTPPGRYNPPTVTSITTFSPSIKAYTDTESLTEGTSQFENGFEVFDYPNAASNETHIRFKPCKYRQYYKMNYSYIDYISVKYEQVSSGFAITNIEKFFQSVDRIFTIYGVD